jgi:hypothetical protein
MMGNIMATKGSGRIFSVQMARAQNVKVRKRCASGERSVVPVQKYVTTGIRSAMPHLIQ